ncbi:MAG: aminomethyl transferase family protein [Verrucomicrobia bacterium]|nr:aminomethyl transferase family protein [Verrucomicrobiota bacterium]MCH8526725.1 aminomethyl transferase family protein [Kiritimatiellia bacterium]
MDLKDTPLTQWHQQHGANLAEFGGYRMPLWYKTGPIQEHRAVITQAGLFDTSHMAELLIEGPNARELIQRALTKDLRACLGGHPLEPGRATYGFILNEQGHLIDDAIVMMEERERFLLVVNAGTGATVTKHLLHLGDDLDVTVSDLTGRLGKIDLQGPAALNILKKVLKPNKKLETGMPYFGFIGHYDQLQRGISSTLGFPVMVSRTGYTGEFGFELFVRPPDLLRFWEQLIEAGAEDGLIPCGLGARDSLRTGAVLPLSHQDLGDWPAVNHPWRFALPWKGGKFSKSFHGDEALLAAMPEADHTFTFIGENGRKVDPGARVLLDGEDIGAVLTCATDMAVDRVNGEILSLASPGAPENFAPKGLACGFIKINRALPPGTSLTLQDKRRALPVSLTDDIRPDRTARRPWPAT